MSSFNLLSNRIQKIVWDMKWETFTEVQEFAIPIIIEKKKDVILSAPTASGKTEAAFLPILNNVEKSAQDKLKVLYISPLKALINNQFERLSTLTEKLNINVTKWHGDSSQSKKKKLLKKPTGILQITPESIESLLINKSNYLDRLFSDLEYIVIDEIHSFIGTARGVQLRSLIYRTEEYCNLEPKKIGLSATLSNFEYIKKWLNPKSIDNIEIIESSTNRKDLFYSLAHFPEGETNNTPLELFEDLRVITRSRKTLIFCNSRGDVEETTVMMNRLSKKDSNDEAYFAHHSSIDKSEREYVEKNMVATTQPKSIVATSSLELGIDIGSLDMVVQIDSTFTVSSLKQRLGRSGRMKGSNSILQLYSTSNYSLLQSLAVMELLLDEWVEPAESYEKPFDILFHQILSICSQKNGLTYEKLFKCIRIIGIFDSISADKILVLINYMINKDYLELIKGSNELIVGIEGERLMRHWEYYSVFVTFEEYNVFYNHKKIGRLDKGGVYNEGDNIILAGKLWKILKLDINKGKVYVLPASSAKKPRYQSGGSKLHNKISEKMHEILCSEKEYSYLTDIGRRTIDDMRQVYSYNSITIKDRVVWKEENKTYFESYVGNKIANTLLWMFRCLGYSSVILENRFGLFSFSEEIDLFFVLSQVSKSKWKYEDIFKVTRENEYFSSKFSCLIPEVHMREIHLANEVDIKGAIYFCEEINIKTVD